MNTSAELIDPPAATLAPPATAAPPTRETSTLRWRLAVPDDAEHLLRIYNESIAGGGHSPMLTHATAQEIRAILARGRHKGWPLWVMAAPADMASTADRGDGEGRPEDTAAAAPSTTPVAWAHMRSIVWAPDACRSTGDLWIYVAESWHGTGIAMRMIRRIFKECRRYGFDAVTCWILGVNHRSLSLARACRLERWARMPDVVDYGGLRFDLEVWGCRLDDPVWLAYMDRLERRHAGLERLRAVRAADAAPGLPA
ncbi:hypothetical protein [Mitsuaria sp. GD03876]|uniref:GNAT family N-acetyltransferase n=1 Tax=Mitsuaria sp. GD03876 TaxID=2975399 RepID=UPI0024488A0A|nr:hypothetical protein [Mitsuaria sp. GD03876]MDH0865328.1 hypothetical protein [Mitsuaria sp. GD03876]